MKWLFIVIAVVVLALILAVGVFSWMTRGLIESPGKRQARQGALDVAEMHADRSAWERDARAVVIRSR